MPGIALPAPSAVLLGYLAAADLRQYQYCLVKRTAANAVNICTGATDDHLGVLINKPNTGEPCEIVPPGSVCMARVDGNATAITAGLDLTAGADGRGHVTATDKDTIMLKALDDSSADGDIIACAVVAGNVSHA